MTLTEKQLADKLRKKGMVGSDKAIVSAYLKKNPDHARFINNNPGLKLDASSVLNTRSNAISNAVKTSYKPTSKPSGQYNKYVSKQTTNNPSYNPKPATITSAPKRVEKPKLSDIKTYGVEEANRRLKLYEQQEAADAYQRAKRFEQEHPVLNFAYESFIPYGDYSIYNKNRNKRLAESNISEEPTIKQMFKNAGTDIVNRAIPYANIASFAVGGGAGNIAKGVNAGVKAAASSTKLASNANKIVKSLEAADKAIRTPVARQMVTGAKHSGTVGGIFGVTDAANSNLNRDGNLSEFITKPLVYGGAGAIGGALSPALNAGVAAAGATDNILANLATGLLGGAVDASALATGDYYLHLTPEERAQRSLQEQILEYLPFAGLGAFNAAPSALKGVRGAIRKGATNIKNPGIANTIADTASTLGESLEGMPGQYQKLGEILSEQQRPIELRRTPEEQAYINQTQGMPKNNETVFKKNIFEGTDAARRYQEAQEKPTFTQDVPPEEPARKYTDPNAEANRAFMEPEEGLEPGTIERTELRNAVENAPEGETIQHTNTGSVVEPTEPPVSDVSNAPQQKIRIDQERPLKTNSVRSNKLNTIYNDKEIEGLKKAGFSDRDIEYFSSNNYSYKDLMGLNSFKIKKGDMPNVVVPDDITTSTYKKQTLEPESSKTSKDFNSLKPEAIEQGGGTLELLDAKKDKVAIRTDKGFRRFDEFYNTGKISDKYRITYKTDSGVYIVEPKSKEQIARDSIKKQARSRMSGDIEAYNTELGRLQNKVKVANSKYRFKQTEAVRKAKEKAEERLRKFKEKNKQYETQQEEYLLDEEDTQSLSSDNQRIDEYNDNIDTRYNEQDYGQGPQSEWSTESKWSDYATDNQEWIRFWDKYKNAKSPVVKQRLYDKYTQKQYNKGKSVGEEFESFVRNQAERDAKKTNTKLIEKGSHIRKPEEIAEHGSNWKPKIPEVEKTTTEGFNNFIENELRVTFGIKRAPGGVLKAIADMASKHYNTIDDLQRAYNESVDKVLKRTNISPKARKAMIDTIGDAYDIVFDSKKRFFNEGDVYNKVDFSISDENIKFSNLLRRLNDGDESAVVEYLKSTGVKNPEEVIANNPQKYTPNSVAKTIIESNKLKYTSNSENFGSSVKREINKHYDITAEKGIDQLYDYAEQINNKKLDKKTRYKARQNALDLLESQEKNIRRHLEQYFENEYPTLKKFVENKDKLGNKWIVESSGDTWNKYTSGEINAEEMADKIIDDIKERINKIEPEEPHIQVSKDLYNTYGLTEYKPGETIDTLSGLINKLNGPNRDGVSPYKSLLSKDGKTIFGQDVRVAFEPSRDSGNIVSFSNNTLYIDPKANLKSSEFTNAVKAIKEKMKTPSGVEVYDPFATYSVKKEIPVIQKRTGNYDGISWEERIQASIAAKNTEGKMGIVGKNKGTNQKPVVVVKRTGEPSASDILSVCRKNTNTAIEKAVKQEISKDFNTLNRELTDVEHSVADHIEGITSDTAITKAVKDYLSDINFKFEDWKDARNGRTEFSANGNRIIKINKNISLKDQKATLAHEIVHAMQDRIVECLRALGYGDDYPVIKMMSEGRMANAELDMFSVKHPDIFKVVTENSLLPEYYLKDTFGLDAEQIKLYNEGVEKLNKYEEALIETEARQAELEGIFNFFGQDIGAYDGENGFLSRGYKLHKGTSQEGPSASGSSGTGNEIVPSGNTEPEGLPKSSESDKGLSETSALNSISINPDRTRANVSGMPFANLKDAQMYEMNRAAKNEAELATGHVARKLSKEREGIIRKWDIYTQKQIDNRKKMMGVKRRPVKDSKGNIVLDENGNVKYKYEGVFISQRRNKGEVNVSDKSSLKSREKVAKVAREASRRGLKNLSPDEIMRNVIDDHIEIKALDKLMDTVVEMSEDYNGKSTPKGYEAYNEKLLAYCKYANLSRDAYNAVLKGPETIKKTFAKERQLCSDLLEQYNRNSEATKVVPSNVIDKILSYNNETAKMASGRYGKWSWPTVSKVIEETSRAVTDPFKQAVLSTVGFITHNIASNYHQILANSKNPIEAGRNWFKAWQTSNEAIPSELIDNNLVEAVRAYSEAPKTYTGFTEFDAVANLFGGHLIDDSTLGKVIKVMDRRGRIKEVRNKKYNPLKYHSVKAANTFARFIQAPFAKFANSMTKFNSVFEAHERKWALLNEMPKVRKDILKATGQQITLVDEALKHIKGNKQLEALVVKRVEDILGDYRNFSPAEKKITKQLVPFVSWFKAATRMNYKLFKKNPSRWLMLQANEHKKRSEDEMKGVKEFQQGSIPVEVNGKKYRSNLSNYTATNYLREVKDGGDILQSMNPHVQNIIEASRGKKIFGDGHIESKRYKYIPFGEHKGKYVDTKTDKIVDSLPVSERLKYMGVKAARTHILGNKLLNLEARGTAVVHAFQGKGYKLPDKMYDTSFGGYYDGDVINGYKRDVYMPRPDEIKLINKTGAGLQPEYPLNKKEKEKLLEKIKKQKEKQNKRKKAS